MPLGLLLLGSKIQKECELPNILPKNLKTLELFHYVNILSQAPYKRDFCVIYQPKYYVITLLLYYFLPKKNGAKKNKGINCE